MNNDPILIVAGEPNSIFSEILVKSFKHYNKQRPIILFIVLVLCILQLVISINLGGGNLGIGSIFIPIISGFLTVYFVSIFSILNFVHPYEKWPDYLNNGKSIDIIIWGNDLLLDILPHRYEYIDKGTEKLNKLK